MNEHQGNFRRFVPTENFKVRTLYVPKHIRLMHKLECSYEKEKSPVRRARIMKKYEALYNKYFKPVKAKEKENGPKDS